MLSLSYTQLERISTGVLPVPKPFSLVYHATSQPVSLVQVKVVREGEREGWEWEGQKINAIIHSHELLLQAE